MSIVQSYAGTKAPNLYVASARERYAYRRFGKDGDLPLLLLQHFTGTLDFWDPALTDALARNRDVILLDNAGIGNSSGTVPTSMTDMAQHVSAFLDALHIERVDVLGFSLGGCIAQVIALAQPERLRRLVLVGTAPEGGEDIMHLDKPELAAVLNDRSLKGYESLGRLFFTSSVTSQEAGAQFVRRLAERTADLDRPSGPEVAAAQIAAFQTWENNKTDRFESLRHVTHPSLVVHGIDDAMIGAINGYWLAQHIPNATLVMFPDSGHGALDQYYDAFAAVVQRFLAGNII